MKSRKRLVVGVLVPIEHPEPQAANDSESAFVVQQIFDAPLKAIDGTDALEPVLFRGPLETDDGGQGYRFRAHIRDDIRFSDGSPMTPEDVADSLRRATIIDEQGEVRLEGDVVRFRLAERNARFDLSLAHPKCSVVRRMGQRLIGTGPFMMQPDSVPTSIRLVRNPHHLRPVALDEVEFRSYTLDAEGHATSLLGAIQRGEVDLCNSLARDDIVALSGVRKSVQTGSSVAFLFFNTERPALANPQLRRALAHSIDRHAVAKTCYSNALAFAATGMLPRTLGTADDHLRFDPERAQALLGGVGVTVPDRLRLLVTWGPRPYLPKPMAVARVIADQLAVLGCTVSIEQPTSGGTFNTRVVEGNYDLSLAGWIADTLDPCDFLQSLLASDRIATWDNLSVSANDSRWRSGEVDIALARYRAERSGTALGDIAQGVDDAAPLVPLMYGAAVSAWSDRVHHYRATSQDGSSLAGLDVDL